MASLIFFLEMRFNMFKGLKGIIFVGLLSLLTTLTIAFTQGITPDAGTTFEQGVFDLSAKYAEEVFPQANFEGLLNALINKVPQQMGGPTSQELLANKDQHIEANEALWWKAVCWVVFFESPDRCGDIELEARGFDVSDPVNFVANNEAKIEEFKIDAGVVPATP